MKNELKKSVVRILEGFIGGILTFLFPFFYSGILSILKEISIKDILFSIPFYMYFLLLVPFILWLIFKIIRFKMKRGIQHSLIFSIPIGGYKSIGEVMYKNLIWVIQIPNNDFNPFIKERFNLDEIHIKYPPKCPNCKTELNCNDNLLWYTWSCVDESCGFIKRTWNSSDKLERDVKKLVKSDIEKQLGNEFN